MDRSCLCAMWVQVRNVGEKIYINLYKNKIYKNYTIHLTALTEATI